MSAQQTRKKHVLLVDDDASLRRALTRTFRLAGFDVEAFASAETLIARGICPNDACLVLDVDLPGTSGFECKRQLDAAGDAPVPTIFITALPPADVDATLAAFSPVAVLYKPFDKDDLLDAVERACS